MTKILQNLRRISGLLVLSPEQSEALMDAEAEIELLRARVALYEEHLEIRAFWEDAGGKIELKEVPPEDRPRLVGVSDGITIRDQQMERLCARVAELEGRLEVDHVWTPGPDGKPMRKAVPPEERPGHADGIDARDSVIQMRDERIRRQGARIAELEGRLELDYEWTSGPDGSLVRQQVPPEKRTGRIDAVASRDAAIRLMQGMVDLKNERIFELEARIAFLEGGPTPGKK